MKKEKVVDNNKSKASKCATFGVLVILTLIFVGLIIFNNVNNKSKKSVSYEQEQLTLFSAEMLDAYKLAENMEYDVAKSYLVSTIYDTSRLYGGNDSVDYYANQLLNVVVTDASENVTILITQLKTKAPDLIDDILNGDILKDESDGIIRKSITLKSSTVCNDSDIDQKYCVEKLNARVYVTDKNSDKWAVLIHGYMMSGSLMYMSVGEMYTSNGYNVIAPDLRGFGSSDGSVAMGYLESLDIYDWIKDLNLNWNDQARYGVNKAPSEIIVHGISLGGATTLQLATNPDIASASDNVYNQNLDNLHVKGFIDDCGYTSMSGIITGMLSMGDTLHLSSIFSALDIEEVDFINEFNKLSKALNLPELNEFNLSKDSFNFNETVKYLEKFSTVFGELEEKFSNYEKSNGQYSLPEYNTTVIDELIKKYGGNYIKFPVGTGHPRNELGDNSAVLDGLVGQALMNLVGVGLTEDNYARYSNVFSAGRGFSQDKKVMIIHGTADTTVPYSNAQEVANNVSPATLVYKWDVSNAPHAFIVVGMNKDEYSNLISKFIKCVNNSECVNITK